MNIQRYFQNRLGRASALLGCAMLMALSSGCATVGQPDPHDPWEGYNRGMTRFNNTVDDAVFKPVATAYKKVLPKPVRTGVSNFFGNLGDVWSFINNVLQAKPEAALSSFWRVVVNSTIGFGGVLDPATDMRLQRYREDFGQTLGYWGVPSGPYFVLPLLGPSTLRDTAALPVDFYGHPLSYVNDVSLRNSLSVVRIIDTRAQLLDVGNLLDAAALDPYTFRRDAYLQMRRNDVHDGNPPQTEERYDLDEKGQTLPVQAAPTSQRQK
ncbi:MAG: VacJ family lipoprotein [Burkholderiaceae bacterium]|jgi:phospholipid-binding lipoprotein MlaA|nr:VacJ family lipoprotein [Burkholderiaceae bacterium]